MGTDRDHHQPGLSRTARAKHSHTLINKTVPSILRGNARARRGIEAVELIVDPPALTPSHETPKETPPSTTVPSTAQQSPTPKPRSITLTTTSTLHAASTLTSPRTPKSNPTPPSRLAILNMASPLRPGGGVLTGATSQEESLCRRTTLYPSLHEHFYRLPEVGAIYTPDVLVFHSSSSSPDQTVIDDKKDWFFVDVVTASMLRFPELEGDDGDDEEAGGRRYAEQKDREMVVRKMTAVMRILRAKGVGKVVLGAWGCGAYGNPIGEIARAWKRVLLGGPVHGKQKGKAKAKGREQDAVGSSGEMWDGLEVVFAINDAKMAEAFARAFGLELVVVDQPVALAYGEKVAGDDDG
ncbi:hypothetical protein B0T19DRAFT_446062 [Cercophora scortea]|uniref:Microbial-type PARG catalytic domain-containing protein n=1 Tax=Cercophora scortea TaxID=314031 RepID=A0AAE0M5R0_9PEZI|nr:hypothetical protein B0T19DRAFT_446062 [Cercophora scortea]